jgi:glycosyltransferase involved in cell wall biosynthesis
MNVALLCRGLHTAGGLVVGLNFIKCLNKVAGSNRYLVAAPPGVGYENIELPPGSCLHLYRGKRRALSQWRFDALDLPNSLRAFKPDVVFGMGNLGLTRPTCPQAILFHKPQLIYPAKHYERETRRARFRNLILKMRLKKCLKGTQLVFCQTPVAKQRFSKAFGFPEQRIRIMPNAVSEFVKVSRDEVKTPEVFSGARKFTMFFLTKFYAHKNLEILIDLFKVGEEQLRDVRCIVTVAAEQHPNASSFLASIRKNALEEQIVNVGPLRAEELPGYFHHSDALFFPSLLESFSGTFLEAMHFGLPILTSDLDFAAHVCRDAALYFNPWDPSDIVAKICRIRDDPSLRNTLTEQGLRRVKDAFPTWEEITSETIHELERLG